MSAAAPVPGAGLRYASGAPMVPLSYCVADRTQETEDTFTLELVPGGAERLPPFAAGQFNMLYLFGVGEVPISVSGDPTRPKRLIHTTRAVGTVTNAMAALVVGAPLGVRGPFGIPWPVAAAEGKDLLLVAGGIGLAPLRPVLLEALSRREQFGRITLLYGARTQEDLLFRADLARWRARFDLDIHVTVDRASRSWKGNVGVVTDLVSRASFDPHHTIAMTCGPEIMMRYAIDALKRRGLSEQSIYLSMERNMKCAVGFCGHCQYGASFVCRDGPVYRFDTIAPLFGEREV